MPALRVRRPRRPRQLLLGLLIALAGCQQITRANDDADDDWEPPEIPWWEDGPETGGDDDPSGDGDGDDGDPGPAKLDMPDQPPAAACSVVDLLFVIDNSNSMVAEQANLIASFDGFISGIQANLDEANDYHVGVVTTDAYGLNQDGCRELGALVTHSAAGACGPWTAGRFISLADELGPAFTCAANVGVDGDTDERQIDAALRAIGPELGAPGGCNEGFIRDDALLVLVVITDEDDGAAFNEGSAGGPVDWYAKIVARKGVESNVVVLALAGLPPPNQCDNNLPFEGAQITYRIEQFIEKFTYGDIGDVCADDYSEFFANSLSIIHDACLNFTPEG
ncbi:hypothetical protein ENSA5_43950 [Enhygromyxa salina]|uniref:VWFA domain-containing protein n=1 Tax=Enhygromyxa salina TaxID=215803 RepID=A0A2S9XK13_9BACT|nr:hypothetical protein [Enhygromyxa salina]PRP93218.1 hypothetical protein ENSA5_43950 [Enhygromyxa salina]